MATTTGGGGRGRERTMPGRTTSQPALPRLIRGKQSKQLVRQQASLDSLLSPDHTLEHVALETVNLEGETVLRKVFVTEVNGTRTLDLYGGCGQDEQLPRRQPLTHLPSEVCDLIHLQRLWASHNLLSSLPPSFPHLTHVRQLFLQQNKFIKFPTVICSLPSLHTLWLSHNHIPNIPDDITNLSSLRRLHLDHNQIGVFPDSLTLLPHLTVLYLNNNNIQSLSEHMGKLTDLQHLILHENIITELPRGLTELTSLQRLDLRNNQMKHLSKEFRSFQAEKNSSGAKILTAGNPLDKTLTRMLSTDQTSPMLRPRTMSFPLTGYATRRKSESTPSPSPSPSSLSRRHVFYHSQSEDRA